MKIVVDAMGSDDCPVPDVAGSVLAAQEYGDQILIVGDESRIRLELAKHDTKGLKLEVVPATEVITMFDKPGSVGKQKPNSSMHVGLGLVRDGLADAFVTAGNTGAAMSIATLFTLRRISGIKRPALCGIIRVGSVAITVLDVGANTDSKPEWLVQFAKMGDLFNRRSLGIENPRIGLLSNGEEEGKGDTLVREAGELLKQEQFNYIGNVEPKHLLTNKVDVVVTDGYVGNILLKAMEASTRLMANTIRSEIRRSPLTTLGGLLARPAFSRVAKMIDPAETGGAPLLGVDGVVIIGHGSSNAFAIKNAVNQARRAVLGKVTEAIASDIR